MCIRYEAARSKMWAKLIPGYAAMDTNYRKAAKKAFADKLGKLPNEVHTREEKMEYLPDYYKTITFDTLEQTWINPQVFNSTNQVFNSTNSNTGAQTMCYTTKPVDEAKSYIESQLDVLFYDKRLDLCNHFKLHGIMPKNKKEAAEWFKSGNYRIVKHWEDDDEAEDNYYKNTGIDIRWGKDEPDQDGYDEACLKMRAAKRDVLDLISVVTDETKRLEALQNFRSATFC